METSIFMDLKKTPQIPDLEIPLGKNFQIWQEIRDFIFKEYPAAIGRVIRFEMNDSFAVCDIKKLIEAKLMF